MKKKILIIAAVVLVVMGVFLGLLATRSMTVPFFYRIKAGTYWSIGTIRTNSPFDINCDSIAVIDYHIQHSHPEARFMADPFIVEENGEYYIFYEYFPSKMNSTWGDIAVLKSTDLQNWEFLDVVLDEQFHLSYPQVFKHCGKWYMIPETGGAKEIRLYATDNFPYGWKLKKTLVKDRIVADATLIIKDDVFYLLAYETNVLSLFYSDNIDGEWQEHPQSPIRDFDIRPGGRPVVLNDKITYFIQDYTYGYGTGLMSYEIDSISPTYFADHKGDTVLWQMGEGWAADFMHHHSAIQLADGSWFCVVDGGKQHEKYYGWDWLNFPKFTLKNIFK